ncbi:uncharacterized protein PITG_12004 [Phytophthora infestans T30-4]|uniref:Uncharacterized protein n=1 Tax=Phytophthora infestans (strain T30-4) TaxID=403677 RepID=D0NHQ9_PHYIT|nr:uncharacterized protein PITG_12004 [Phytophthora infestans T30-4]EEY58984.1 conserved hypothetical protein [Phytophthora infestans T30-4]|eukprot:XP_002901457.1 conserved hypothetical protein [Phytophthora infestans T30-4]
MLDPDRTPADKRFAALTGTPQDTIRNAGISFQCDDRDICTKLGGEPVTICGRKFKVQPYSKYSHWYYVDLQRLPDDATDGLIYDWLANKGQPPVYITPAHVVGGLRSRSRRVYFNQKLPPASVMLDKRTPLRQIQFTGQGYSVVHHRNRAYNSVIPPFIKVLCEKGRQTRLSKPVSPASEADDTGSIPPAFDNSSDTSEGAAIVDDSASEGESHSGDHSDEESCTMDGIEAAVVARPKSVWPHETVPTFPVGSIQATDFTPARIKRAKTMVFGTIADPAVDLQRLPPSQQEYPTIASFNSYEWLSEGANGPIPPDQDLILWDRSNDPPQSVASYVGLSEVTESVLNAAVYQGNVEQLSLQELCAVIEDFLGSFSSAMDPDTVLSTVHAQPSLHRAFGHVVLRELSSQVYPSEDEGSVSGRLSTLYPNQHDFDFQTILGQLCSDQSQYWLKLRLAEADLALQIIAPSIYADPLKLSAVTGKAASALPHPLWFRWGDSTLANVIISPLMDRIVAGPLPTDLRSTIEYLCEQAASVVTSLPTRL